MGGKVSVSGHPLEVKKEAPSFLYDFYLFYLLHWRFLTYFFRHVV